MKPEGLPSHEVLDPDVMQQLLTWTMEDSAC